MIPVFTQGPCLLCNNCRPISVKSASGKIFEKFEEITIALDQGEFALSIFFDLNKAFGTIKHFILLPKLIYYGIDNIEDQCFFPTFS